MWAFLFLPQVSLLSFSVESEHTFLDYIKGGWVQPHVVADCIQHSSPSFTCNLRFTPLKIWFVVSPPATQKFRSHEVDCPWPPVQEVAVFSCLGVQFLIDRNKLCAAIYLNLCVRWRFNHFFSWLPLFYIKTPNMKDQESKECDRVDLRVFLPVA